MGADVLYFRPEADAMRMSALLLLEFPAYLHCLRRYRASVHTPLHSVLYSTRNYFVFPVYTFSAGSACRQRCASAGAPTGRPVGDAGGGSSLAGVVRMGVCVWRCHGQLWLVLLAGHDHVAVGVCRFGAADGAAADGCRGACMDGVSGRLYRQYPVCYIRRDPLPV